MLLHESRLQQEGRELQGIYFSYKRLGQVLSMCTYLPSVVCPTFFEAEPPCSKTKTHPHVTPLIPTILVGQDAGNLLCHCSAPFLTSPTLWKMLH